MSGTSGRWSGWKGFNQGESWSLLVDVHRLDAVVGEAKEVLGQTTARQLLEVRYIQGFDVTGLAALFDSVPHFRGNTQEIVHMARLQLGDTCKFAWTPATPKQGATP
jgi:hypothetical protein